MFCELEKKWLYRQVWLQGEGGTLNSKYENNIIFHYNIYFSL